MIRKPVPSARHRRLSAQLLRAWRVSLPTADWQAVGTATLRADAETQLLFGAQRKPGQTLLRVSSPPLQGTANHSYSIVELITDDMPFLVDTLYLALSEAGYGVQLISHPILGAVRGANGRLLHFRERRGGHAPISESWQYLRIDRVPGAQELAKLRTRLLAALVDVRYACEGWQAMRQAALAVREQLERQPPPLPAAVVAESAALLAYMEDNHFTFLGFRRSRLKRRADGPHLEAMPGTALGIMRTHPPGDLVPLRAKRELLVVTKANLRSTVHRPGYLDYIVVKAYDRRGRLTGEAQFLGLMDLEHLPRRSAHRAADAAQGGARDRRVPLSARRATTASGWSDPRQPAAR